MGATVSCAPEASLTVVDAEVCAIPDPLIAATLRLGTSAALASVSTPLPSLLVIRLAPEAVWFSLMVLALAVAVGAVLAGTGTLMLLPLLSVLSSVST